MDTKVTFETAKLAKEVGFDLEVYWYYYPEAFSLNSVPRLLADGIVNVNKTFYDGVIDENNCGLRLWNPNKLSEGYYSAPTQTTLWKWMREKGIEVYPPLPYGDKWACSLIRLEDTQFFDTWEEALENELYNKLKSKKQATSEHKKL